MGDSETGGGGGGIVTESVSSHIAVEWATIFLVGAPASPRPSFSKKVALAAKRCESANTLDLRESICRNILILYHVYLNSVQQMVSGGLAREGLQAGFSRHGPSESSAGHGLPPQRAPKQCPANGVRRVL